MLRCGREYRQVPSKCLPYSSEASDIPIFVPSHSLNDWRAYFSNVEGLKPGSSLYSTGSSGPNHPTANPFSSESFQQQQQHVPSSAPSRVGDVEEINDLFGGQGHRPEGDLRFNW